VFSILIIFHYSLFYSIYIYSYSFIFYLFLLYTMCLWISSAVAVAAKVSVPRWGNRETHSAFPLTFAHQNVHHCAPSELRCWCAQVWVRVGVLAQKLQKLHPSASLTKVRWNCVGMACLCLLERNNWEKPVWTWYHFQGIIPNRKFNSFNP
jgi:hypothetical protein